VGYRHGCCGDAEVRVFVVVAAAVQAQRLTDDHDRISFMELFGGVLVEVTPPLQRVCSRPSSL